MADHDELPSGERTLDDSQENPGWPGGRKMSVGQRLRWHVRGLIETLMNYYKPY